MKSAAILFERRPSTNLRLPRQQRLPLKVEAVEALPIRIKAEEKLRGGTFAYSHYQTVLVTAVADGVEGWAM